MLCIQQKLFLGERFRDPDQKHVWALVIGYHVFASSVALRWHNSSEVCDRLHLASGWRIVKSNKTFVNYLLKHDGMIVRIQADIPSLLVARFTSSILTKF